MDMNDTEVLLLNAGGGANSFLVGNMTGTDLVGPITYVGPVLAGDRLIVPDRTAR